MDDFLNELTESTKKSNKKSSPRTDSSKKKRRPPSSNCKIFQFLDDLSIDDENGQKADFLNSNDGIFKIESDSNKLDESEGNRTEIKFNHTFSNRSHIEMFESSIVSYLDLTLRDFSSNFLATITDLSEETFNNLYTEKVSNFLNDINKEIDEIVLEYQNYDKPQFQTDEIMDDFKSQIDEIDQQIQNSHFFIENSIVKQPSLYEMTSDINLKKAEMMRFSSEVLNDIKIERNKLLLNENSMQENVPESKLYIKNKENESMNGFINDLLIDFDKKELTAEIEKKIIDEKLTKIENKKKIIEEKRINLFKEKDSQQQAFQYILDSKESLFNEIKNYQSNKSKNYSAFSEKVSNFSQQMFFDVTQCRMMVNNLFQKLSNINQINQSFENLKKLEFQNNLRYINAKNAFLFSAKKPLDFIEQTQEKLKELQSKRDEAKKLIENVS